MEQSAPEQPTETRPPRAKKERGPRKERKPRVHEDLLTVAYPRPTRRTVSGNSRSSYHLSLARLLQDALLAYEASVAKGYEPGTALAEWKAQQKEEENKA